MRAVIQKKMLSSNMAWVAAYTAVMAILPLIFSNGYHIKMLTILGINTIMVLGLNLLMGYAGQVSIGHAAFFGIGAYASAIATAQYGLSPWHGIAASVLVGGVVAYVIAIPTLRLKGHYLAMATLGFAEIVHVLLRELTDFTGGTDGLSGIPAISIPGFVLDSPERLYGFVLIIVSICLMASLNIAKTRVGRVLRAVHGSEIAASASGVDTAKYKVQVFVFSAVLGCIAGSLYAHMAGYVSPDTFTLGVSIMLVTMVVFGGMSSVWGAIVGASALTILQEYLTTYDDYNMVIFGAILVLAMVFMPAGLVGMAKSVRAKLKRRSVSVPAVAGDKSAAS